MATRFGEFTGTVSPIMKWYAEYSYTRTSNSVVQVTVTVVGDIVNTASTSYMGSGANVVITASVGGSSQTYEIKSSTSVWRGSDSTDPRSHTFTFNVTSTTAGTSIPVSYSVAGSGYTAAAKVPTKSTTFSSPALLYTASVPSMAAATMGTAVTINTNRQSDSMVHTLTYTFGSASGTIGTAQAVGASVSWTPPLTLASQIPSATKGSCTITCKTYVSGTLIGTNSISITLSVPASVVPTCSLTTALVTNGEPTSWGIAVQGYTKVKCTATASGAYGSTIKSYKITGGGYSSNASTYTTGALGTAGTNKFTLTVTDTRDRTATVEKTITVYAYSPPTFSSTTAYRSDSSGARASSGTYIYAKTAFSYASVNSKNSVTCTVAYRANNASIYSGSTSLTSGTAKVIGAGAISTGSSYVVQFTLKDGIKTITKEVLIGTVLRSFHIKKGGRGVAFGKVAETDDLVDSAWPIKAPTLEATAGLTTYAASIASESELDTALNSAYAALGTRRVGFATFNVTASGISIGGGISLATIYRCTDQYGWVICSSYNGRAIYRRDLNGGTWGNWRNIGETAFASADHTHTASAIGAASEEHTHTAAEVGAAPSGYGLGGEAVTTDWNNATETGFYKGYSNSPNGQWFEGFVIKYSDVYCIQSVWRVGEHLHYERNLVNGTWGSWVDHSPGKIGARIVNVGSLTVPTYSTTGSNGSQYYGDVTVTGGTFATAHTAGRPWVFLQCGAATTGVTAVEPVEWTASAITKIRIHRASSATNVAGFTVYYYTIGT